MLFVDNLNRYEVLPNLRWIYELLVGCELLRWFEFCKFHEWECNEWEMFVYQGVSHLPVQLGIFLNNFSIVTSDNTIFVLLYCICLCSHLSNNCHFFCLRLCNFCLFAVFCTENVYLQCFLYVKTSGRSGSECWCNTGSCKLAYFRRTGVPAFSRMSDYCERFAHFAFAAWHCMWLLNLISVDVMCTKMGICIHSNSNFFDRFDQLWPAANTGHGRSWPVLIDLMTSFVF